MLRNKKKEATEHRAVLVLRGAQLSDRISDTDPKKENLPVKESVALDHSKEAERTAEILNRVLKKVHEILKEHPINKERERSGLLPANGILTRGAGQMPQIEKITKKLGFKACCIASESTVLGVASLAGFDIRTDQSFTGNIDTDIYGKATLAAEALKNNDLVVLHFKATDLMGHDNNPTGKVAAIEKYDQMIGICLEQIKEITSDNVIVALAADHSTPCERREHSGDPVPVLINGKNIRHDTVEHYDEISCSQGGLGRIKGSDFINILLDYLEVVVKQGN
ncbi:MAG: alkaline phosphatase family protein [Acetivibrio ethanolgignens]